LSTRQLDLYDAQLVAIDGSKFKAVTPKRGTLNEKMLPERLKRAEDKIAQYLKKLEENDEAEQEVKDDHSITAAVKIDRLREKLAKLEE
jgi:transposase